MTYPNWAAGQRVTAAALASAFPLTAYKTLDEPLANSAALQNDGALFVPVVAGAAYALDAFIQFLASAPPDIRFDWTIPAGAAMTYAALGTGASNFTDYDASVVSNSTVRNAKGNGGVVQSINTRGHLLTGATAGVLQFRWAQNTSNAAQTIVKAGSWIRLQRVG